MLHKIVVDVIEMIVVFTKSYDVYKEISDIILKLKGDIVHTRIKDKLTYNFFGVYYLEDYINREYDKPYYMVSQ